MKRLLCTVAVLALISPQVVMAQSQNRDQHRTPQQPLKTANATQTERPTAVRKAAPARTGSASRGASAGPDRSPRSHATRTSPVDRTVMRKNVQKNVARPNGAATTHATRTSPVGRTSVTHSTVQRRAQRSAGYHPAHVTRVHATTFRYPSGYRYQRWSAGGILPSIFLSNSYYYNNWYDLGFGPPPRGDAWVRYGPDLLLVNIRTGRVVDVVYGVFY